MLEYGALDYGMYILILFGFILVYRTLGGIIKGSKKTLFNLIVVVIFYAFFLLTINFIAPILWTMKINPLGKYLGMMMPELSGVSRLKDALPIVLAKVLTGDLAVLQTSQEFMEFANAISIFIVKMIYFILYFTVFALIYKIITFFIRIIFVKNKKDAPKHRFFGAGLGFARGVLNVFVMSIFIGGLFSVIENSLALAEKMDGMPTEQLKLGKQVVTSYNDNIIVKQFNKIKVKDKKSKVSTPATLYVFDKIFSFEYNDEDIALRKEIAIVIGIADLYVSSDFADTRRINDLKTIEVEKLFQYLEYSDLVVSLIPLGIEVGSLYYQTDLEISLEELYLLNWRQEIRQLGSVTLLTLDLLEQAGLLEGKIANDVTFNSENIEEIFSALAESNAITVGAKVALQPILESASQDIKAIITLPEDLDIKQEILAIGTIAAEFAGTGINVGELKSKDPTIIVKKIATADFTTILQSKIVSQALVNIFSGKANVEGLSQLVIPENIIWYDFQDEQGETVKGELRNILLALNAIAPKLDEINFDKIGFDILSKFDDQVIDRLFESQVLRATVSKLIQELDLGSFTLVIADNVLTNEREITKDELKNLAKAAQTVATKLMDNDGEEPRVDIDKIFTLTDADLEQVFQSKILTYTISQVMIEETGDALTIPTIAKEKVFVNGTEKESLSVAELKAIFKGAKHLGIDSVDAATFNLEKIKNLGQTNNPKVLDDAKVNDILQSKILQATISKYLIQEADTEGSAIVVPHKDSNDQLVVRYYLDGGDQIEVIHEQEVKALIQAALLIDLTDFSVLENLVLKNFVNDLSTILNSNIIHATLSKKMLEIDVADFIVPHYDDAENPIVKTVQTSEYITKDELIYLLEAFSTLLGDTPVTDFGGAITLTEFFTNPSILTRSAIIRANISNKLFELYDDGNGMIVIPKSNREGKPLYKIITKGGQELKYIAETELNNIIYALAELEIDDVNGMDFGISHIKKLSKSNKPTELDQDKLETVLTSAIVHATLSDFVLNEANQVDSILVIPTKTMNEEAVIIPLDTNIAIEDQTEVISVTEFGKLVQAVLSLEIDAFDDIKNNLTLSNIKDNMATILASSIIHATISEQILDKDEFIMIPTKNQNQETIVKTVDAVTYLDDTEILRLIDALVAMGYDKFDDIQNTLDSTKFFGNVNTLLASAIIHANISDKLFELAADEILTIPNHYFDDIMGEVSLRIKVDGMDRFVAVDEVKQLFKILEAMNKKNLDLLTEFTLNEFFANRDELLKSAIIRATISERLTGSSEILVPDLIRDKTSDGFVYVTKAELDNLLKSFELLSISSFDDLTINLSKTLYDNIEEFLTSKIIQATISKNILDFAVTEHDIRTGLQLIVPTSLREEIPVAGVSNEQIAYLELVNILKSLEILGANNYEGSMEAATITNLDRNELATLMASGSVHITINNMLKENTSIKISPMIQDTYYEINDVIEAEELINFIVAVQLLSDEVSFTNFEPSIAFISNIENAQTRDTVIESVIIRHSLTEQLVEVLESPFYNYHFLPEDYEVEDHEVLTYDAFKAGLDYLI